MLLIRLARNVVNFTVVFLFIKSSEIARVAPRVGAQIFRLDLDKVSPAEVAQRELPENIVDN